MKKILSLILMLALSSVLMLTACSSGGDDDDGTMNAEKWEDMLSAPNFENYTLKERATVMGVETVSTVKIAGDKVELSILFEGESDSTVILLEGSEAQEQKRSCEELFLALLADFDNFTYDEESKTYKTPETPITVSITMTVEGEPVTADIIMENGVVSLTEDGKLLQFDCNYTQTTTTPDGPITITTEMHMEFSNYGTTVIK